MNRWLLLWVALPAVALGAEPLSLEQAVQLALERNERARIATERVAAAEARLSKARSFFFPTLSLTGTYTRQPEVVRGADVVRPENTLTGTAAASLTIFDG